MNLNKNKLSFKKINPEYPTIESVIRSSIGSPTPEKIAQVLKNYQQQNQFLIGSFASKDLIGLIGFEIKDTHATIKHLSVIDGFRKQGIAKYLIHELIKDYTPSKISLETDDDSVGFYLKLGFTCTLFEGEFGNRYRCSLDLLSSQCFDIQDKLLMKIKDILHKYLDMHGEIAVSCGDQILYHEIFSYPDAPWVVNKNSQYLIGSITKQFTAAAILKALYDRQTTLEANNDIKTLKTLIEKDLQKPVSHFLPEGHEVWGDNMPNWANTITLHHLLTHTSGIKKISETVLDRSLEGTPGEQFLYSNPTYVLIGKIISVITGSALDDYYKCVLFDPADMQHTYFPLKGTPKDLKQQSHFKNLALGFEYHLVPSDVHFSEADEKISFEELSVAGGMVSTIKDCIKWNNALYQGKIIPMPLVELMLMKHIPAIPFPIYYGLDHVWYGYGIEVYYEDQKICYQHSGGCPGYQGRLIYLPTSNITIIHLSNSQKDNVDYIHEKKKIIDKNHCDDITAEAIFDKQFPHYKSRIEEKIKIFSFANALRELFL